MKLKSEILFFIFYFNCMKKDLLNRYMTRLLFFLLLMYIEIYKRAIHPFSSADLNQHCGGAGAWSGFRNQA